jgi:hypothetical protein
MALSAASRGATPTKARENWRSWTAGSDRAALEALQKKHDK